MNSPISSTGDAGDARLDVAFLGHVAVLTFSHPKKRNALNASLLGMIAAACRDCMQRDVRAMVLRSSAGSAIWSSGHDIDALPLDGSDPLASGSALETAIDALRNCAFPVIAMVQGAVFGGAVEIVMCCDIVIADDSARFAMTPANIGLPYNTRGLLHFAERLSIGAVKEMFFTAAPIGATDAFRLGIVNRWVPAEALVAQTMELASGIAEKAPLAIAAVKAQLRMLCDPSMLSDDALAHIAELRRQAYRSADFVEGVAAFRAKRRPSFKGRFSVRPAQS
ncbi:methylmalonyl-CoA decarboxylase [Burkholderia alba]|uniref:methylmalonyl-CoA decarboxylase n=1 Tax=Burkholderia alba TaxID=2683677 RepID=UPI002B0528EF|nr:methylmalonyl-CoA decarboxylase [Burkholderia alba]